MLQMQVITDKIIARWYNRTRSSGSPFDGNTHRIVGQLYAGTASCTSITYDTYGMLAPHGI